MRAPSTSRSSRGSTTGAENPQPRTAEATYDDLLDELRSDEPEVAKPYEVTLVGRWSETERRPETAHARSERRQRESGDAARGTRRRRSSSRTRKAPAASSLSSVVPGRRYVVGKDADCDIVVDGVYASRRHCELWLDKGAWWVTDCGSTNGIRVEPASGDDARRVSAKGDGKALAVEPGARVVLSASATRDGDAIPSVRLAARRRGAACHARHR